MQLERSITTPLLLSLALVPLGCGEDEADPMPLPNEPGDVVQVASANADFSTLVSAIQAADLVSTLKGPGPFTVFAPTNAAFAKLPAGALDALLADKAELTKVLTYHVVPGKVTAAQVVTLNEATTVQGEKVTIAVRDGKVYLNGTIQVTSTDIPAKNGVIHVIDAVLLPPEPAPQTITAIAAGNPDFSTLVAALQAAGLDDTLAGAGPFTVFAPTNAAFAALPAGTVDALLANIPELTKVLTYHVVPGKVEAAQVVTLTEATTVQGEKIQIEVRNGEVFLNGTVKVTATDIQASNGVIHVIDAVLLPPAPAPQTITAIAAGNPDFSTLVAALQAADLDETLAGAGPFTVFAPTNAAFAALPAGTVDALLANIPELTKVLTYHVVSGKVEAAQVVTLTEATTVQGAKIKIEVRNGEVFLNGTVKVTATDIQASNGVIHVIDAVLLPPTIADLAQATPELSTLVSALVAADLVDTLEGPGPFTVFAPVNSAFAALPAGALNGLLADIPALTNVLTYHVVPGRFLAADVAAATTLPTAQGTNLSITATGGEVRVDGARVIATDIIAGNGVVHLIDAVMLPEAP